MNTEYTNDSTLNEQMAKLQKSMTERFNSEYTEDQEDLKEYANYHVDFEVGKKYIRIVKSVHGSRSCAGFIVATQDAKFKYGAILKAGSWKAPAMNFARGSIFNDDHISRLGWTGVS